jgi:2-dehydro-3-deoxygluconokinase
VNPADRPAEPLLSQPRADGPAAATGPLEIVGFGEAMVLLQPDPGQDLATADHLGVHVAGAELNLCAAAARVGLRAGFCSRVGDDPFGARVIAAAQALDIDTSLVTVDPRHPTGLFLKQVLPDGARRVHYYRHGSAASTMDLSAVQQLLAVRPRVVAVSGVTAALGPAPRAAVLALAERTRARGVLFAFDPNLRPALGPVAEQIDTARGLLPHVDILLLGLDEAEPLFGTADPERVFAAAAAAGVRETVLKAGPDGAYVRDGETIVHLPSQATVVVDPVGGGDAFAGGYLAARLRGATPQAAADLGSWLAAGVIAAPGDTFGLPTAAAAAEAMCKILPS